MKRLFSILFTACIILTPIQIIAMDAKPAFCKIMFGEESNITFEPVESNYGVTVTDNALRKIDIKRDKRVKAPTSFRCVISELGNKSECPPSMTLNKKRTDRPICLSKTFQLRELCPTELTEYWPELVGKNCKNKNPNR